MPLDVEPALGEVIFSPNNWKENCGKLQTIRNLQNCFLQALHSLWFEDGIWHDLIWLFQKLPPCQPELLPWTSAWKNGPKQISFKLTRLLFGALCVMSYDWTHFILAWSFPIFLGLASGIDSASLCFFALKVFKALKRRVCQDYFSAGMLQQDSAWLSLIKTWQRFDTRLSQAAFDHCEPLRRTRQSHRRLSSQRTKVDEAPHPREVGRDLS